MAPVPLPNTLDDLVGYVDALELDGVVLTGGNDIATLPGATNTAPERDRTEHQLIDWAAARGVPVLGVCRGMQILVLHHGGTLRPVEGHVATPHGLVVSDAAPSGVLGPLDAAGSEVNSYHGFGLRPEDLGPTLQVMATAPDGTVEAVAHPSLRQWGIMWHPERAPFHTRDADLIRACFSSERTTS